MTSLHSTKSRDFYEAAWGGHLPLVKSLSLDPEIEFNWKEGENGWTPFHIGCLRNSVEIVRYFLDLTEKPIDFNLPGNGGWTPFFSACYMGHEKVVSLLLADERIDLNTPNKYERTPFWVAAENGKFGVIKLLLASGREIDTRRKDSLEKKSAADMARSNGVRAVKYERETEEEFTLRKKDFISIAELIEAYEKDPSGINMQLRRELGDVNWLEEFLGVPLLFSLKYLPEGCRDPKQIKQLFLEGEKLTTLPPKIVEFVNLREMDLSGNPIDDAGADSIAAFLKTSKTLKVATLTSTKIGPKGMLKILQAMVWNLSQRNFVLGSLEVDNMLLESLEGLEIIPIDILEQGSRKIVQYLLDLYCAPDADPLFRSKLMVVGFAEIGKTSMLECLFPMTGILFTRQVRKQVFKAQVKWQDWSFELVGNNLIQTRLAQENPTSSPGASWGKSKGVSQYFGTIRLNEDDNWAIVKVDDNPEKPRFASELDSDGAKAGGGWTVVRIDDLEKPGFRIEQLVEDKARTVCELFCSTKRERERWFERIEGLLRRERTHGIDIREIDVSSRPAVKAHFAKNKLQGKLELSVWDFAGQHDYYNNHHHFLSTRSVFLVLWNVSEFDEEQWLANRNQPEKFTSSLSSSTQGKGMEGLRFWLMSLSTRLSQVNDSDYFKIIVVGTHFDRLGEKEQNKMGDRRKIVAQECERHGLELSNYLEVSCINELENINELQDLVFEETLRMKYMRVGERIPLTYLSVESFLQHLLEKTRTYPVVDIHGIIKHFRDERLVRDALGLLSKWGKCVYFENDERLRDKVVLDPQFLSKTTLAGFFRLGKEPASKRVGGVICHGDLKTFWTEPESSASPSPSLVDREDFWEIAELLISLMEKFDVCFVLPEDKGKPFQEQRSLIPSLLPEKINSRKVLDDIEAVTPQIEELDSKVNKLQAEYDHKKPMFDRKELASTGITAFLSLEKELKASKASLRELQDKKAAFDRLLKESTPWQEYWPNDPLPSQTVRFERIFQFEVIPAELVGRVVARLHNLIEHGCVMSNSVLFRLGETQANLTVDMSLDQFLIEVRSSPLENRELLLTEIKESISGVLSLYSKKQLIEGVRSPHSRKVIPLDLFADLKDGTFKFENEPVVSVKMLRETAGLAAPKPYIRKQREEGWDDMVAYVKFLGGNPSKIGSAFDLEDPGFRGMFESHRGFLYQQHHLSPDLFKKKDHDKMEDAALRSEYLNRLNGRCQGFSALNLQGKPFEGTSEDEKTQVVPMAHGTREAVGWKIAQSGFGIVSSLDVGWYGQGIYFTSDINYAQEYAEKSTQDCSKLHRVKVLLIALVNPGNSFPVTEDPSGPGGFRGKNCRTGYQSHYSVVNTLGFPSRQANQSGTKDELVVFELAQALPKYLIYYND